MSIIKQYQENAKKKLEKMIYDYYEGGSDDEFTLKRNIKAFNNILLLPRVLTNVSSINIATKILDIDIDSPIIISPIAFQKMAHPDGEKAIARANYKLNTIMTLSTVSTFSIEDVANEIKNNKLWFQLYVFKDRLLTQYLIERARNIGYKAIVITVDSAVSGNRERDILNTFKYPPNIFPENIRESYNKQRKLNHNFQSEIQYFASLLDSSLNWEDIKWIVSIAKLPVLLKGILCSDDALIAVDCGISGIIVSNHGGRQLDTVPASIECLKNIVVAVRSTNRNVSILLDGGIRRGSHIFKALALGANAVMIGRPVIWGLAHSGEDGVINIINSLKYQLRTCMALCGCTNISQITSNFIIQTSKF